MPPAITACQYLFVRQHRAALGTPIHAALFPVRQPALQHAQKEPLVPAVILRLTGRELPPPVVAEAETPQHALKFGNIFVGPLARVSIVFDCRVFCRQAEGIPAHRVQHIESAHALHARYNVPNSVIAHVAHVHRAARVRQHFQHVILGLRRVHVRIKYARLRPALLPLHFDFLGIVSRPRRCCAARCDLFRHARLSPLLLRRTFPCSALLRPRFLFCASPRPAPAPAASGRLRVNFPLLLGLSLY